MARRSHEQDPHRHLELCPPARGSLHPEPARHPGGGDDRAGGRGPRAGETFRGAVRRSALPILRSAARGPARWGDRLLGEREAPPAGRAGCRRGRPRPVRKAAGDDAGGRAGHPGSLRAGRGAVDDGFPDALQHPAGRSQGPAGCRGPGAGILLQRRQPGRAADEPRLVRRSNAGGRRGGDGPYRPPGGHPALVHRERGGRGLRPDQPHLPRRTRSRSRRGDWRC